MSWPVEPDKFKNWCENIGGNATPGTNNFTGDSEMSCTFDKDSEEEGARVKTFISKEGYLFARDTDNDSLHKIRDVERVYLTDEGIMEVSTQGKSGKMNHHDFDFTGW